MARESWTDERLDDLSGRVDSLERRMDEGFREMREEFRAVRGEIGELNRTLSQLAVGLIGAMTIGFIGTVVTILTQV